MKPIVQLPIAPLTTRQSAVFVTERKLVDALSATERH